MAARPGRLRGDGDGLDGARLPATLRPRRRLSLRPLGLGALIVVLLVVAQLGGERTRMGSAGKHGVSAATVTRQTLVERESVQGTLGYSGARAVVNRLPSRDDGSSSGAGGARGIGGGRPWSGGSEGGSRDRNRGGSNGGAGTVTGLAREGSIVGRGETLYELDGRPVLLMYGAVPAYRKLGISTSDGPDVRQLEQNLVALGFGSGITVDEDFTAATAAAVRRWQGARRLPETGHVELGRVVFLRGARRVGAHKAEVGSVLGAGSEVLMTSSVRRVVTVELDAAKHGLVHRGDGVTVTLPDGRTVRGRIARVGGVARKKDEGNGDGAEGAAGGSSSGSGELVVDLSIMLRSRRGVSRLDQAPVTVGIAQDTRRRVLAVPITALLARAGGGYGVEVVRAERRRIVAVETGLFAGGLVEISARGIRPGTKVAIPEE